MWPFHFYWIESAIKRGINGISYWLNSSIISKKVNASSKWNAWKIQLFLFDHIIRLWRIAVNICRIKCKILFSFVDCVCLLDITQPYNTFQHTNTSLCTHQYDNIVEGDMRLRDPATGADCFRHAFVHGHITAIHMYAWHVKYRI